MSLYTKGIAIVLLVSAIWFAIPSGQIFLLTFTSFVKTLGDKERMEPAFVALRSAVPLAGRTCMVTGANRGLGKATAAELVAMGCRVLMACRPGTPEASAHEVVALADVLVQGQASGSASSITLDVSDLDSVNECVRSLEASGVVLDLLTL
jgi:hypothetical protein